MRELFHRSLLGGIAILLLGLVLWLFPLWWMGPIVGLGVALVAAVGLWEFYQLAKGNGFRPAVWWGVVLGILYILLRYLYARDQIHEVILNGSLLVIAFLFFVRHFTVRESALASVSISLFGILYVIYPLSLILDILYRYPNGRWWFLFPVAITVGTDMGAYLAGKLLGNFPLARRLSPNKTLEGAFGGMFLGLVAALILSVWMPLTVWQSLLLGLALTIVGQVGDLAESLFKRDANVKDSSRLPGLGGMLDVVDSLLFNLPLTYLALQLVYDYRY